MSRVDYRPLEYEHIRYVGVNEAQKAEQIAMLTSYGDHATRHPGLEAWDGNRCLGMAGLIPVYPGRFLMAWALMSRHAGPHMLAITRQVRRMLDAQKVERIEMTVRADFTQAHKWARMCGFECEAGPLRKRGPGGNDEYIYARVN